MPQLNVLAFVCSEGAGVSCMSACVSVQADDLLLLAAIHTVVLTVSR